MLLTEPQEARLAILVGKVCVCVNLLPLQAEECDLMLGKSFDACSLLIAVCGLLQKLAAAGLGNVTRTRVRLV